MTGLELRRRAGLLDEAAARTDYPGVARALRQSAADDRVEADRLDREGAEPDSDSEPDIIGRTVDAVLERIGGSPDAG